MKSCLITAALIFGLGAAQAATITATFNGVLNSNVTVSYNLNGVPGSDPAGLLGFTNNALNQIFLAYCLEPNVVVGTIGQTVTYEQAPGLTLTASKQAALRLLLGQVTTPFASSLSQVDQAALQLGIWEIARETAATYAIGSGAFSSSFSNTAGVLTRATQFLDAVNAGTGTSFNGVIALTNGTLQDLVVIGDPGTVVPEPGTLTMLGGVLVALGLARRFRR